MEAALRLESNEFSVKLVEPSDQLFFYPLAHRVVQGYPRRKACINYSKKFEDRNIEHVKSKARSLDSSNNFIRTESEDVGFDYAVLAFGARQSGLWPEKTVDPTDPLELERISRIPKDSSVIVVGGGSTGVEMSAAMAEMGIDVRIVHEGSRLLERNSKKAGKIAQRYLEKQGVDIKLNEKVKNVNGSVETSNSSFRAEEVIWAGGTDPNTSVNLNDIETENQRVKVDRYQQTNCPEIFAVGDCCFYQGKKQRALHSLKEAKCAVKNILRRDSGKELKERSIKFEPSLIHVSKKKAIFDSSKTTFSGLLPHLMEKYGVEKRYMTLREKVI